MMLMPSRDGHNSFKTEIYFLERLIPGQSALQHVWLCSCHLTVKTSFVKSGIGMSAFEAPLKLREEQHV